MRGTQTLRSRARMNSGGHNAQQIGGTVNVPGLGEQSLLLVLALAGLVGFVAFASSGLTSSTEQQERAPRVNIN